MNIVIFGLSVSSAWGNGHATLWRGLIKGLARRKHAVTFFERDVPYYAAHRDCDTLPEGELCLYDQWKSVRPRALRALAAADAALVTSYCPDGVVATELILEQRVPITAFYDLDTPVTLERLRRGQQVDYLGRNGLRDFDLVLSFTGGASLAGLERELGARRAVTLYGGVDPSVHAPAQSARERRADLAYLGTYARERQSALDQLFLEPARRLPERTFLLGGAQYPPDFAWTSNLYYRRHVPPSEHPAFYADARLHLNVTRAPMAEMGYCPSGRLFEAAACDAAVISDCWPGFEQFYRPGEEMLLAHDTEDVLAALELGDAELERMSRRARDRTLAQHTLDHRAGELVEILTHTRGA